MTEWRPVIGYEGYYVENTKKGNRMSDHMSITIVESEDLDHLLAVLGSGATDIYSIRFHQTHDGRIKIKVNNHMWSPALGQEDK